MLFLEAHTRYRFQSVCKGFMDVDGCSVCGFSIITTSSCVITCPAKSQGLYFCSSLAFFSLSYQGPSLYFTNLYI